MNTYPTSFSDEGYPSQAANWDDARSYAGDWRSFWQDGPIPTIEHISDRQHFEGNPEVAAALLHSYELTAVLPYSERERILFGDRSQLSDTIAAIKSDVANDPSLQGAPDARLRAANSHRLRIYEPVRPNDVPQLAVKTMETRFGDDILFSGVAYPAVTVSNRTWELARIAAGAELPCEHSLVIGDIVPGLGDQVADADLVLWAMPDYTIASIPGNGLMETKRLAIVPFPRALVERALATYASLQRASVARLNPHGPSYAWNQIYSVDARFGLATPVHELIFGSNA